MSHRSNRTLPLPPGDFSAYLFDCDGTIADTMPIHYEAWKEALAPWNCPFTEEQFYGWAGTPIPGVIEKLNLLHGKKMPAEEVSRLREEAYFRFLPLIKPVPEVLEHIDAQKGRLAFAVVSGSPRESVLKTLTALKLLELFPVIVAAEDVVRAKPDPEPFLTAARKLGVEPARCLVFEDAEFGIQAAKAGGMGWVRVPQPWERE